MNGNAPTHVPLIAKQPAVVKLIPTLDVVVAEPLMLSPDTVVVPKPELDTVNHGFVVEPTHSENASPPTEFTASLAAGDVVPIPTFPSCVSVVVAVPPIDA